MSEQPHEVAWLLIEPGWKVVTSDGSPVGKVHEVVGDPDADIFNGIAVSPGRLRHSKYVPAERVSRIVDGCVELAVDHAGFDRLEEHTPAPTSAEILAPDRES